VRAQPAGGPAGLGRVTSGGEYCAPDFVQVPRHPVGHGLEGGEGVPVAGGPGEQRGETLPGHQALAGVEADGEVFHDLADGPGLRVLPVGLGDPGTAGVAEQREGARYCEYPVTIARANVNRCHLAAQRN
jgi:hypothetical protein